MKNVLFRLDASSEVGGGHLMRCLALAQACRAEGWNAGFIGCLQESFTTLIEQAGYRLTRLDRNISTKSDMAQSIEHIKMMRQKNTEISWVVVDAYHLKPTYINAMREESVRVLQLDDTASQTQYQPDLLLNQNVGAEHLPYHVASHTRKLMGSSYALLRSEYSNWNNWQRTYPSTAQQVLITLGASDPDGVAVKLVQSIKQHWVGSNLSLRVLAGPANPHLLTLKNEVGSYRNLQIRVDAYESDMPSAIAKAELVISAGGSTVLELAYMGAPMMLVILAENQTPGATAVCQSGAGELLGHAESMDYVSIVSAIKCLVENKVRRQEMGSAGHKLVDGKGAMRVVEAMKECD